MEIAFMHERHQQVLRRIDVDLKEAIQSKRVLDSRIEMEADHDVRSRLKEESDELDDDITVILYLRRKVIGLDINYAD